MTDAQKTALKLRLKQQAVEIIEQRIAAVTEIMQSAQAAANEQEKSSAGDKYETSRAMNQLEKEMFARQLAANRQELSLLAAVDCSRLRPVAVPGSFIRTKAACFLIAAGLGKIDAEGLTVFMLSPHAPLALLLLHKQRGDTVRFNHTDMEIEDVF